MNWLSGIGGNQGCDAVYILGWPRFLNLGAEGSGGLGAVPLAAAPHRFKNRCYPVEWNRR